MAVKFCKDDLAAALDTMLVTINAAPDPGWVEIRTGAAPAQLEDASTGTLLSTCVLVDGTVDAFAGTPTTSPLTAVGFTSAGVFAEDPAIAATGTAGYFRLFDSVGTARHQGSVGTSGTDLVLDSVSFVTGGTVTIDQWDLTIS